MSQNGLGDARRAAGLTQTETARRWGRSQSQVARLERVDLDTMKIATLRSYAEALGGSCRIVMELGSESFELSVPTSP